MAAGLPAFLALVMAAAAGVLGCVRLGRGMPLLPAAATPRRRRGRVAGTGGGPAGVSLVRARWAGAAVVVGVLTFAVTRWPVAGVLVAALVGLWPRLVGAGALERSSVATIDAIATWTESLRDTAAAASGLEYAIPATLAGAPPLLERPIRDLVHRLSARVPLPEALTLFADDVADPSADLVVAALALNARQRAGSLTRVLTTLAASTRQELEMRRRVLKERDGVRRQAQQVAALAVLFAAGQAVLTPRWVAPYGTGTGQLVLAVLVGAYLGLVLRLRKLATPEPQPRFLGQGTVVTEMASYRPQGLGS